MEEKKGMIRLSVLRNILSYRSGILKSRGAKKTYPIHVKSFRGISYLYRYIPKSRMSEATEEEKELLISFHRFQRGSRTDYKRFLKLYYKYITQFLWMTKTDKLFELAVVPSSTGRINPMEILAKDLIKKNLFNQSFVYDGTDLLVWNKKRDPVSKGNYYTVEQDMDMLHVTRKPVADTVIVIDDVIKSGNTAIACEKMLKQAGAKRVYVLCLFACRNT